MTDTIKQRPISLFALDRRLSVQAIATAVDDHWGDIAPDLEIFSKGRGNKAVDIEDYILMVLYDIILPATNSTAYSDAIMERTDDEIEIFIRRIENAIKNKANNND